MGKNSFKLLAKIAILVYSFSAICFYQAMSEIYVDGARGFNRDSQHGLVYANFVIKKGFLDIDFFFLTFVKDIPECGKLCVDHKTCFSANFGPVVHEGRITNLCQLLPSDIYNNSNKFVDGQLLKHLSIKVGKQKISFILKKLHSLSSDLIIK